MKRLPLFCLNSTLFNILFFKPSFTHNNKITGKVIGGTTGEPLPFINILILETIQGAVLYIDVYNGSTIVDININSIQKLQFVSGEFNTE